MQLRAVLATLLLLSCARAAENIEGDQTIGGSLLVAGSTHTLRQTATLPETCKPAQGEMPGEAVIVRRDASLHFCVKENEWKRIGLGLKTGGGRLAAGRGVQFVASGDEVSVEVDSRQVPGLGDDNTWAGHQDFSLSTMRLPSGDLTPHPAGCTAATAGRVWVDTNPGGKLYFCMQPMQGQYRWMVFEGRIMPPPAGGSQ